MALPHWPGATSTGASGRRSRWRWRRGTGRIKVHKESKCRKLVKLILRCLYIFICSYIHVIACVFLSFPSGKCSENTKDSAPLGGCAHVVKRRFGCQLLQALREAKAVELWVLLWQKMASIRRWRCFFKLFPTVQHSSVCSEWLVFFNIEIYQEGLAAEDEFQTAYMKCWGCFFRWKAGTTSWFLIWVNLITSNIKQVIFKKNCCKMFWCTRICILTQETSAIRSLPRRLASYKSAHMWQRSPMEPASNERKWHPLSKSKNVDLHKINARIKMRWRARQW